MHGLIKGWKLTRSFSSSRIPIPINYISMENVFKMCERSELSKFSDKTFFKYLNIPVKTLMIFGVKIQINLARFARSIMLLNVIKSWWALFRSFRHQHLTWLWSLLLHYSWGVLVKMMMESSRKIIHNFYHHYFNSSLHQSTLKCKLQRAIN